jgi:hypothetical protein
LQQPKQNLAVTDARLKIISKKRVQITDAREKLAELAKQKDARLKIEQMRLKRVSLSNVTDNINAVFLRLGNDPTYELFILELLTHPSFT